MAVKILVAGVKLALLQGVNGAVVAATYVLHNFGSIFMQWMITPYSVRLLKKEQITIRKGGGLV